MIIERYKQGYNDAIRFLMTGIEGKTCEDMPVADYLSYVYGWNAGLKDSNTATTLRRTI